MLKIHAFCIREKTAIFNPLGNSLPRLALKSKNRRPLCACNCEFIFLLFNGKEAIKLTERFGKLKKGVVSTACEPGIKWDYRA